MPSSQHRDLQKQEMKYFPQLEMMSEGVLCLEKMWTRKIIHSRASIS